MRRIASYFFLIVLTLHTFSQLLVVGKFLYNQDYIAANLCENKDQPELECNGKCHLKKELKKDTKDNHSQESIVTSETILFYQNNSIEIVLEAPSFFIKKNRFTHYVGKELSDYNPSIFHPPC